jgi:hypothetical protein
MRRAAPRAIRTSRLRSTFLFKQYSLRQRPLAVVAIAGAAAPSDLHASGPFIAVIPLTVVLAV